MITHVLSMYASITPLSSSSFPHPATDGTSLNTALGIAFGIIGALAALMVAISGLRYILSAGNPQKISQAKDGIIYSLVGVAVSLTAEAIVHFVVNRL